MKVFVRIMIQNLIITTPEGLPLFARSLMCHIGMDCIDLAKDNTFTDETVLNSALFSAKLIFDDARPDDFHDFKMEKSTALTFPTSKITVILNIDPSDDVEEYRNRLRLFADLFVNQYDLYLQDFSGSIEPFTSFQDIIAEEGLLEEGERFRKNCIECEYDKACIFRIETGDVKRTFKERFENIIPIGFFKKFMLVMIGMFQPRYMF
ncbi:MAG: hypothetical protein KAS47_04345 [Candidatus Heimdallarchaeota archaeon]|nr:hypothetical protein [Candidatus Heimdallarchaeota archaeon]